MMRAKITRVLAKSLRQPSVAQNFVASDAELAAVEFAFVLPIMLLVYLGLVELTDGVRAAEHVDLVAHVSSDLLGQTQIDTSSTDVGKAYYDTPPLLDATISNVFAAASALMTPYPVTNSSGTGLLQMTVSEIMITASTKCSTGYCATVDWTVSNVSSAQRNGTGCTTGTYLTPSDTPPVSLTTIPTAYTTAANSPAVGPIIVVDVVYSYTPKFQLFTGLFGNSAGFKMQRTSYSAVRNTYVNPSNPALYNHILYYLDSSLPSTYHATNCLAPTL